MVTRNTTSIGKQGAGLNLYAGHCMRLDWRITYVTLYLRLNEFIKSFQCAAWEKYNIRPWQFKTINNSNTIIIRGLIMMMIVIIDTRVAIL